jgi:hypothetical protein
VAVEDLVVLLPGDRADELCRLLERFEGLLRRRLLDREAMELLSGVRLLPADRGAMQDQVADRIAAIRRIVGDQLGPERRPGHL